MIPIHVVELEGSMSFKPFVVTIEQGHLQTLSDHRVLTEKRGDFGKGWLRVGQRLQIDKPTFIEPYAALRKGPVLFSMGSFSYSRSGLPSGSVVGRYSSIATGVRVMGDAHPIERLSTAPISYGNAHAIFRLAMEDVGEHFREPPFVQPGPAVHIGNDAWVGGDVLLKRGVSIGHGAVIAARTVVTKDVPPYAVVAGNPGRIRKMRFEEDMIADLLELKWWDFHLADLRKIGTADPAAFAKTFRKQKTSLKPWDPAPLALHEEFAGR